MSPLPTETRYVYVHPLTVIVNLGKVSPVGAVLDTFRVKWQSLRRAYLEADLFGKLVKARAFLNPVGYLYGRR